MMILVSYFLDESGGHGLHFIIATTIFFLLVLCVFLVCVFCEENLVGVCLKSSWK